MKIVLIGDSITDMYRNNSVKVQSYGCGYPFFIEGELSAKYPEQHTVYNRGVSGNRIVDLYQRIKQDCWNLQPDLVSILVGVNDVWHDIEFNNGVEPERFERFYRMFIEDTKKALPNVKFMLLEPFFLNGEFTSKNLSAFEKIYEYADIVRKLAYEYNIPFVSLQKKFTELSQKHGTEYYLFDGIHPSVAGAKVIAEEWLKAFENINNIKGEKL